MKKLILIILTLLIIVMGIYILKIGASERNVTKSGDYETAAEDLKKVMRESLVDNPMEIRLEGHSIKGLYYKVLMDDDMKLYVSEDFIQDILGCAVRRYKSGDIALERGSAKLDFSEGQYRKAGNMIFIPVDSNLNLLDFDVEISFVEHYVDFSAIEGTPAIPSAYDMRKDERVTPVRDQGKYGTCWAFASLGALESSTMPYEESIYSPDHMALSNSYKTPVSAGGDHTMSIAYMAAWQGPVLEKDDPYGDKKTDETLAAAKHLEEAIIINERDDDVIKGAIFRYGGIETSLYFPLEYGEIDSDYYNDAHASYYMDEKHEPNHDIVVVGWDDDYPKESFNNEPKRNGAFICKNSWGTDFGDEGYFYVSYEDPNICTQSVVYTRVAEPDNFDNIYQTDKLGWVGQMGFSDESAYFANVYTAKKDEKLGGVSFYATDKNTEFSVYLVHDFKDTSDFEKKELLVSGGTRYAGYYTAYIPDENVDLKEGERFAVVVFIKTKGAVKPVAVEYKADSRTANVDITDGEGYISQYGKSWIRTEDEQDSNVCLKAFTYERD